MLINNFVYFVNDKKGFNFTLYVKVGYSYFIKFPMWMYDLISDYVSTSEVIAIKLRKYLNIILLFILILKKQFSKKE